jgi:predicted dehydrogenase
MKNNSNKLKVALIGGAINSAVGKAHFAALSLDNNYEIVSGCFSRKIDLNIATAEYYKIDSERIYQDLETLISNEKSRINAIILLTPTDQHAEQVTICLNAGIPVICEKALVTSSAEGKDIKDILSSKRLFLAVIYNYTGYPMLRELKYLIKNASLGRISHIQIEMPQEGFLKKTKEGDSLKPQEWRLRDGEISTISLDLGVHLHMMIQYLTNEKPINVVSSIKTSGNFSDIVDNVSCMITYTNKMTCNMWFTKTALGNRNGLALRIFGDIGSAEWRQSQPEYLNMADNNGRIWRLDRGSCDASICNNTRYERFKPGHPAGFIEALANYYNDVADSLIQFLNGEHNYLNEDCFGIDESLEGLMLFEAIERSSKYSRWETIQTF